MLQQWRLFPYLAAAYVLEYFSQKLFLDFVEFRIAQILGDTKDRLVSSNTSTIHHKQPIELHTAMTLLLNYTLPRLSVM